MKTNLILTIAILMVPAAAGASVSAGQNQALIKRLQAERSGTEWSCAKGSNPEAVVLFDVNPTASGLLSGSRILVIQDERICNALQVTFPFVASVSNDTFGLVENVKYGYWATRGQYSDTALFYSSGSGMKLISVNNGSMPSLNENNNWYFNSGECVQH